MKVQIVKKETSQDLEVSLTTDSSKKPLTIVLNPLQVNALMSLVKTAANADRFLLTYEC